MLPRKQSADSPRKCVHVNFRSVNSTSFSTPATSPSSSTQHTDIRALATIRNPFEYFFYSLNDSWDQTPRVGSRRMRASDAIWRWFHLNGSPPLLLVLLQRPANSTELWVFQFYFFSLFVCASVSRPDIPICHAAKFNLLGAQFYANYGIIERERANEERVVFELRTVQHKWLRNQGIRCTARQSLTHLTTHSEVFFDLNSSRREGNQEPGFLFFILLCASPPSHHNNRFPHSFNSGCFVFHFLICVHASTGGSGERAERPLTNNNNIERDAK